MGAYPRVSVEYRYPIRIRYGYVSVLEYPGFIGKKSIKVPDTCVVESTLDAN